MKQIQPVPVFLFVGLLFVFSQASVAAETWTVKPGESIQQVIDQAEAGDAIDIEKGIYREMIEITKPLFLQGEPGATIVGSGEGDVIHIQADNVTIQGLTITHSGKTETSSGIYIKEGSNHVIERNVLEEVFYGIYSENSTNGTFRDNEIHSYEAHFSDRGNGIHIFNGSNHLVENNRITDVQDGIYFDFTKDIKVVQNQIEGSRYAFHYMFSKGIEAEQNEVRNNINGFMIMDSESLELISNKIEEQFHFRGFGILIYESKDIKIEKNEITRNSTGISLEKVENTYFIQNVVAANQVGLEFIGENESNVFTENNFIGNIVQSKIANSAMRLDDGKRGNYWDDYGFYDLNGDGIGEEAYKAGSLYDQLLKKQPYWQFYFESPSIKLWSKAETFFPSIGASEVKDERPSVQPFELGHLQSSQEGAQKRFVVFGLGLFLTLLPFLMILKGRRFT